MRCSLSLCATSSHAPAHTRTLAFRSFLPCVGARVCACLLTGVQMCNTHISSFTRCVHFRTHLRVLMRCSNVCSLWSLYFLMCAVVQGRVQCTKMMIAVGTEAVEGKSYMDTVKECYQQSVRWQWGAIDLGFLIVQVFSLLCNVAGWRSHECMCRRRKEDKYCLYCAHRLSGGRFHTTVLLSWSRWWFLNFCLHFWREPVLAGALQREEEGLICMALCCVVSAAVSLFVLASFLCISSRRRSCVGTWPCCRGCTRKRTGSSVLYCTLLLVPCLCPNLV